MNKTTEKLLLNVCAALGGVVGAWGRYFTGVLFSSAQFAHFPYATLTVNIVGAVIIGVFVALLITGDLLSEYWRVFVTVGVCGGLTTFSSFSLETLQLATHGHWGEALLNILANVVLSLVSVAAGYHLVLKLRQSRK